MAAIDIDALWDFEDPAGSRERFVAAARGASGDDRLVVRAQIARSYGVEQDVGRARSLLAELEPLLASAGPAARATYWLELGRTYVSAAHDPARVTAADRDVAMGAYRSAADEARAADSDGLLVDALHMAAMVPPNADERIALAEEAVAAAAASAQPAGRRWLGTALHNLGYEQATAGRQGEADVTLRAALAVRVDGNDEVATRVARWMVAWNLRLSGEFDTALRMQEELQADCVAAGTPDPFVDDELALLRARPAGPT